jgi:broad specificity phosphatase PhoE
LTGDIAASYKLMEPRANKAYLVRHAESEMNAAVSLARSQEDLETVSRYRLGTQYMDAVLTDNGKEQAQSIVAEFTDLPICKVFVSPLRRALQTAQILFSEHPLRPQIIVHPLLSEQPKSAHGISLGLQTQEFPNFSWDLCPAYPYILDLCRPREAKILRDLSASSSLPMPILALSRLQDLFPKVLEQNKHLKRRIQSVASYFKAEFDSSPGSICLISHKNVSRELTRRVNGKTEDAEFKNAEIKVLNF